MRVVNLPLLLALVLVLVTGCSGAEPTFVPDGPAGGGTTPDGGTQIRPGSPDGGTTSTGPSSLDGGAADARGPGPTTPGKGSGGSGGPGAGEQDVVFQSSALALHIPAGMKAGTPTPMLVLLHGMGDTGRNFLNVWLARGYAANLIIAAPDDNKDSSALDVEQYVRGLYDVDLAREYLLGFSQGGAYAAFVLFDANAANHFAAVGLASAGLAEDPSSIPAATAKSPAVAVVIDPTDQNNTWNQGLHVMEDFVPFMTARGYDAKLFLHNSGHTISDPAVATTVNWMLTKSKAP